jgi:hypothetical protein
MRTNERVGRTTQRPASLTDVAPTLLACIGIAWQDGAGRDGLDLLAPEPEGPRLRVFDRAELGRETSTFVRRGDVTLGVGGGLEGMGFVEDDVMHVPSPEEEQAVMVAYRAWAAQHDEPDAHRRWELEREIQAKVDGILAEQAEQFEDLARER